MAGPGKAHRRSKRLWDMPDKRKTVRHKNRRKQFVARKRREGTEEK